MPWDMPVLNIMGVGVGSPLICLTVRSEWAVVLGELSHLALHLIGLGHGVHVLRVVVSAVIHHTRQAVPRAPTNLLGVRLNTVETLQEVCARVPRLGDPINGCILWCDF
jgi:hypothetical protein